MTSVNTQTHVSSLFLLIHDELVHINDESHLCVSYDEGDLFIYVWAPFHHGSHINVIYVWAMTCHWRVSHESRHVHAHTCTSHGTLSIRHGTNMHGSCHTHEWVMSHTCTRHVLHIRESCHTHSWVMSHHSWVMPHACMSHGTHMLKAWHTYECVMSHIWMRAAHRWCVRQDSFVRLS